MSVIAVTYDLNLAQFNFEEIDLGSYTTEIHFRFYNGEQIVVFNELSFGYDLKLNGSTVSSKNYPGENQQYHETDQLYLESVNLNVLPDNTYTLAVWCNESGKLTETSFQFTPPIPEKPYSSWLWNGTGWTAPVAIPDTSTGNVYNWNELTQTWDFFVNIFGDTTDYDVK